MNRLLNLIKNNKETKNASWIICGRVIQMIISFLIGLWTARYLGPSNYGLINYVAAYIVFFASFCTLGLSGMLLINELTLDPESEGTIMGTSIALRVGISVLSSFVLLGIVYIVDEKDPVIMKIAVLSCIQLIFQVCDAFESWFQKRYLSKIPAIVTLVGYLAGSLYRVYLLVTGKSVELFALASSLVFVVMTVLLYAAYKKYDGPRLRFSWETGKRLLKKGYHFILSGMMIAVYSQTDKLMLKHMLSEEHVGYYSTAASISTVWAFVLGAIITSVSPTIMQYKKEKDEEAYLRKNRQLYAILFYVSIAVSALFTVFAKWIILIPYGEAYRGAIAPLRIITWYVAFAYLGTARDTWLVCENKQRYSKYMYLAAGILNVFMNLIFIPKWGASGAAMASLLTQIGTSMVLPLLWKDMRPNVKLMVDGILLKDLREKKQNQQEPGDQETGN